MTDPREELRERVAKALDGKAIGGTPRDWTPTGIVNQWSAEYLADAVLDALGLERVVNADGNPAWWAVGGPDVGEHDNPRCSCEQAGATIVPLYRLAAPSGPQEGPA